MNVCTHVYVCMRVCMRVCVLLLLGQGGQGEDNHREHALFSLSRSIAVNNRHCHCTQPVCV